MATTTPRPPVLRFLLMFFGLLAVALGLAAASPADERDGAGVAAVCDQRGTAPLAIGGSSAPTCASAASRTADDAALRDR
jgi:hypothetical protein